MELAPPSISKGGLTNIVKYEHLGRELESNMGQFEIIEAIFNSESPVEKEELFRSIDLHSSSIEADIKNCIQKGHIEKTERGYIVAEDFDEKKLESLRPQTIDDLISDE